jgi:asparagine synthetase B (glutamine-hydrolysing)
MWARGEDPLILLSELQGAYSFALYDGDRRQLFAARDSSGSEPLLFCVDDDGGASVSNAPLAVGGGVEWAEVPPGHYLAGKTPRLRQFALTPAQLSEREREAEAAADDLSPHSHSSTRRSLSLEELVLAD